MKAVQLYLVRHGQTDCNVKGVYYGAFDAPLNETGLRHAQNYQKFFCEIPVDYIVTSPLIRASKTAEWIAVNKKVSVILDEDLAEQNFGIFENKTYEEIKEEFPKETALWNENWIYEAPRDGESFFSVYKRAVRACERLCKLDGTVVVVGHMGTLRNICTILLKMPMEASWSFTFSQGCYSLLELSDGVTIIRKINQTI